MVSSIPFPRVGGSYTLEELEAKARELHGVAQPDQVSESGPSVPSDGSTPPGGGAPRGSGALPKPKNTAARNPAAESDEGSEP